jgi:hypothetical protein
MLALSIGAAIAGEIDPILGLDGAPAGLIIEILEAGGRKELTGEVPAHCRKAQILELAPIGELFYSFEDISEGLAA